MVSSYERELRAVLAGTPDGVRAVTRSCSQLEKAKAMQVVQRPFLVVRAAGSGIEGSGDIVALRGDLCFPIEVKTTKNKKLYLSGRTSDQLKALEKEGERCGLLPLYAQRLKGVRGDSWRI
ncbi:MAG: Holliday junction resolvase, partial [Euryarchaeota archaeon]|nr:Holliday junction resolvase [Euryarchaeota archaeon]